MRKNAMRLCGASICALLLLACGGGGSGTQTTSNDSTFPGAPGQNSVTVSSSPLSHQIQLGPISGASVSVITPDKKATLYSGTTDSKGYFTIDPSSVRSAWEKLSPRPDYVWVSATGGVDPDPNDDGIQEKGETIALKGEVRGIVPIATLLNEKNIRVSLLSSALADVLGDTTDLTDDRIADVAAQLKFPDIDRDGKITVRDVLFYQMGTRSGLEQDLRAFYLTSIHKGDTVSRQAFVELAKTDLMPVRVERTVEAGSLKVKLHKLGSANTIFYTTTSPNRSERLGSQYSDGTVLTVERSGKLFFQECTPNDTCSSIQALVWDGSDPRTFAAAPGGFIGNIYQDASYLDDLRKQVRTTNESFADLTKQLADKQASITAVGAEIATLEQQIRDLDSQIAAVKSGN